MPTPPSQTRKPTRQGAAAQSLHGNSPLEPSRPLRSDHSLHKIRSFNGSDFGEPLISTSVLGAQLLGPLGTFHGCCLYCRSQVGFVGCYRVAFKGIDEQETRTEQTSSPHQCCPGCKCVECRLKKRRYFTRSPQHRFDGSNIVVPFGRIAATADAGSVRSAGSVTTRIAATGNPCTAPTAATTWDSISTAIAPVFR